VLGRAEATTVYRAYDKKFDCQVAFDVFSKNAVVASGMEVAAWETRILGRLGGHPNRGLSRITGRRATGRSWRAGTSPADHEALVDEAVEAGIPVATDKILEFAGGIASGLDHVHKCGLLYRDLQPRNVLLDEWGVPRLVDFDGHTYRGRQLG
jgi:serine/threonine protein kinase